ncbi:BAL-associated protein (macronuclear) [Tetrahymena thermophila SB210]|uniref:RING-type E3 ubiquitin transferase n=1 Tax=Tetrahymena thermophila (strain SB210) TaxID=312017 RepID=Q24HW2_TETTS|nr:BAL-associated protein [Tetrahymena thermophila SB210]EAS07476.1 BAL-associated protein [Tetrahymena thermophila SB210]|eukprot:XP_001027718.1 BAL-associated protein [Tetrahymena thermophila SB210]
MARKKNQKAQQKQNKKTQKNIKQLESEDEEVDSQADGKSDSGDKKKKATQKQKVNSKKKSNDTLNLSSSKIEILKKKIKRTMSNLSEKANNDEMEAEKIDSTIQDNVITYELDPSENEITIKIQKRSYKFNTTSQYVKENNSLIDFIDKIEEYFDLMKKKELRKVPEVQKLTNHYQFTALEYYLMKAFDEIDAKEKKIDNPHLEDEKCCICQFELYDGIKDYKPDDFKNQLSNDQDSDAIGLIDCDGHYFHKECLKMMIQSTYIKCPICSKIYGVMTGDQPDGDMTIEVTKSKCEGYKCNTIVINYNMHGGNINGKYVPSTWRTAYLPDNDEGREVRDLLKIAFDRKLIFTIGRSVTTGLDNQIVWNGIHHKTNTHGGAAYFGYPDPTYFNRVKQELALKGVR